MSEKVSGEEDIRHGEGGILAEVAQGNVGIASMLQMVLERERERVRERERYFLLYMEPGWSIEHLVNHPLGCNPLPVQHWVLPVAMETNSSPWEQDSAHSLTCRGVG